MCKVKGITHSDEASENYNNNRIKQLFATMTS